MWESPTAFLLSLLVLASLVGMVRFAHDATGIGRSARAAHSALQVTSVAGVMIAASYLSSAFGLEGAWSLLAFLGLVWLLGGISGCWGWRAISGPPAALASTAPRRYAPLHHQDRSTSCACTSRPTDADDVPIAIDRVGRKWTLCPDAPAHDPVRPGWVRARAAPHRTAGQDRTIRCSPLRLAASDRRGR